MPYSNDGTGFNADAYTSWLAAQKQAGKRAIQELRILGLYEIGFGIWRQGCLGICSWHIKTAFEEMFFEGRTSAWTARPADMTRHRKLTKLRDAEGKHEQWRDPEGVLRVLYFRPEDVGRIPLEIQAELF